MRSGKLLALRLLPQKKYYSFRVNKILETHSFYPRVTMDGRRHRQP
jgi:hypothetical protein